MRIVLLADKGRTDLLVNFCIAYRNVLSGHELVSLVNTAQLIKDATDIRVFSLSEEMIVALEMLASRVLFNEVDSVIYLQDPKSADYNMTNPLMRACDMNNIPYATNMATAELLILALQRGDLEWRELLH